MPRLFENLWAKLAALLLAALLWFHAATNKKYQYEIVLDLTQIDMAADLSLVEPPPEKITVIVEATGKRLLRSDWKKGGIKLIVARDRPGRFKINLGTDNTALVNSDGLNLVDIVSPREVTLNFDVLMAKDVPVKARAVFVPDQGYTIITADSIIPRAVNVTGPRSLVRSVEYIETVSETHEGIRNNLNMEVPLVYPDIYDLIITPDTVLFVVEVAPVKTRVFSGVEIRAVNIPRGYKYEINPGEVDIRAGGAAFIIDSLTSDMILAEADYRLVGNNGYAPIKVVLPESISLFQQSIDSVQITEK